MTIGLRLKSTTLDELLSAMLAAANLSESSHISSSVGIHGGGKHFLLTIYGQAVEKNYDGDHSYYTVEITYVLLSRDFCLKFGVAFV